MAKTFAQKLSDARLMAAGIRAHGDELKGVSLGEEQAAAIEAAVAALAELDTKQEKLKAELKTCTAELEAKSKALGDTVLDAKKRVKLSIAQSGWQEFGITDKR
ncbi:MAG: hypothetical protein K2M90_04820 [Treponemataceae bacterium]|nr:hypothetical protein [Treponemataceae bacterium]